MKKYDAIVIGSGQAGTPLSKKLAESGLKTALIEKRWVGGTCVNDGCSPTKTMIASAKVAWTIENSRELGIITGDYKVDIKAILKRKNDVVHLMRDNSEKGILKTKNLDLIYGNASFKDKNTITVLLNDGTDQELSADKIFINTGDKPSIPDIKGLSEIEYLTSTSILELMEIPDHLLIIGGGYIGLEFGQMYRRFGSNITMVVHSERLLSKEDKDISIEMEKILSLEKIDILIKSKVISIKKTAKGIKVEIDTDGKISTISCSHILIAAGRIPNTDVLNLEAAGIKTDKKGHIEVNERLETSTEGIFALGDVKGGPAFTNIAFDDYRIIRKNLLEKGKFTTSGRLVPYCVFTDPQLGRIGMTETEALEKGLDIIVATMQNSSVARAIETGDERGMMKAVVDAKTGKILGAAVLAEEGGEFVTILQMAMMGGIPYQEIKDAVFAHPTYAESLNNLFMTLDS
ncbi:mercuric reductase [Dyadobacter sp. NIV53]|uniref:mercuric reductase n=1 Tax=Dyadobacter sp. NIV53 TaxID=2861765 RepID=UPI001C86E03B|nr:mercuric reductase [Dyadobacter sp. NIV53]